MAEAAGFGDSIGHSHALAGSLANKRSTVSTTEKQSTSITLSYAEAHRMPPPSLPEHSTRTVIHTATIRGKGFNELYVEDAAMRHWFVLQRWDRYGYKPFITGTNVTVTIEEKLP